MSFVLKDAKQTGASTTNLNQRAYLARAGNAWKIVSISGR
jgi:hypothetical protein